MLCLYTMEGVRVGWLVVDFKSNCPFAGSGIFGGVPSVEGLLSDQTRIYPEFRRKSPKTPNG